MFILLHGFHSDSFSTYIYPQKDDHFKWKPLKVLIIFCPKISVTRTTHSMVTGIVVLVMSYFYGSRQYYRALARGFGNIDLINKRYCTSGLCNDGSTTNALFFLFLSEDC